MIRIRAQGNDSPESAAVDRQGTGVATAHAIGAGKKVLLFGRIAPEMTRTDVPSKLAWRRRRSTSEAPTLSTTLRVRLTPRGRWRPLDVRPDGTWLCLVELQMRRLPRHGRTVCLQLETPAGNVERRIPLVHWPSSATRLIACSMDVVRAECSHDPSEAFRPSPGDLSRLLDALRLSACVEAEPGRLSGVLVYLSQSVTTLEQDRHQLQAQRLPDGFLLPAGIGDPETSATHFPCALLRSLDALLPRKVRFVLLTGSSASTDLHPDLAAAPALNRLEIILRWPEKDRGPRTPSPSGGEATDERDDATVVFVENASRANEILTRRGLLASRTSETTTAARRRRTRFQTTRYPLVLCHGLLAYSTLALERSSLADYFLGVRQHLEDYGFTVWTPEVGRTHSIRDRAAQLREAITRRTSGPVNLIGHSMGGLDARWMISRLDMADRVPVLVTIATPHRGTSFANWFLERAERRLPVLPLLEALGADVNGYRDVTPEACRRFNEEAPDAEGVTYLAYTASTSRQRVSPVLRQAHSVLSRHEGPNDGMVSVASAARGTILGHLGTDHFCQIGHGHFQSEFDHLGFFLRLARELAQQGF